MMGYHMPTINLPPSCDPIAGQSSEKRITLWNKSQRRKISGNAAPMERNLHNYLKKHPECEVYDGQDKNGAKDAPTPGLMMSLPLAPTQQFSSSSGAPLLSFADSNFPNPLFHPVTPNPFPQESYGVGPVSSLAWTHHNVADVEKSQERRVTIWHKTQQRKISGNAAPMEKNLASYLNTHPDCEIYVNQDKEGAVAEGAQDPENGSKAEDNSNMPLDTTDDHNDDPSKSQASNIITFTSYFDSPCLANPALDLETQLEHHITNFTPPPPRSMMYHMQQISPHPDGSTYLFSPMQIPPSASNGNGGSSNAPGSNSPFLSPRVGRIALLSSNHSSLAPQLSPLSTVESFDSTMDFNFGNQQMECDMIGDSDQAYTTSSFSQSSSTIHPFQPGTFLQGF